MVQSFPGYWQTTPVAGTNAGWINSNGTFNTAPGYYTLEREFQVAPDECSFTTNVSVAWDDNLALLELVPPTGPTISLGIPPWLTFQLSTPIVVSVPSPVAGTWKIRVVNELVDGIGAFILSGSITHFSTPNCLSNNFTGGADGCQGSFTGSVNLPACTELIGSSWTVNGVQAGSENTLNYTFPGNGTYTVCFTTQASTESGTVVETNTCYTYEVTGCCACDQLQVEFDHSVDGCTGHFEGIVSGLKCLGTLNYDWYVDGALVGSGLNYDHAFTSNGSHLVCLRTWAMLADGTICEKETCREIGITNCGGCNCEDLQVNYTYQTDGCSVMLNSTATYPECMQDTTFNWYVDNNYAGSGQNYVHSFTGNGTYIICLRVATTLPGGGLCEREQCDTIVISSCNQPCNCEDLNPGFSVAAGTGKACSKQFTSTSSIPSCMTNIQYLWTVNGVNAGSTPSITHNFVGIGGTYTVCLYIVATLPSGDICEDVYCQDVIVNCSGTAPGGGGGYNLNVILYPNPASSEVTVEFDLEEASQIAITLKTMDGKSILSKTKAAEAGKQRFNLQIPASIAEGVILVETVAGNRTTTHKLDISRH